MLNDLCADDLARLLSLVLAEERRHRDSIHRLSTKRYLAERVLLFTDIKILHRIEMRLERALESSTAPAPSVAAGSFDGAAGAAGGAE